MIIIQKPLNCEVNLILTWSKDCSITNSTGELVARCKQQKGGFLRVLLGTLGASLLGNLLTGKGINKKVKEYVQQQQVK